MKWGLRRIREGVLRKVFGIAVEHPQWRRILRNDSACWQAALQSARTGPKILIATSVGGLAAGTIVESMLAVALTLRGARAHILLCDRFLPACLLSISTEFRPGVFAKYGPSRRFCYSCYKVSRTTYQALDVPIHCYRELVPEDELETARHVSATIPLDEIENYCLDGIAIGEHALAGALRFYSKGVLKDEPDGEAVLRRYLLASLLTAYAVRHLLETEHFESACFHHGIYIPQGIVGEVARKQNLPIVNWNPAYRKRCFVFSHGDTYHHTMLSEPATRWENMPWTRKMERDIQNYLKSRWQGTRDWIWFHEAPQEDLAEITAELGIDFSRPTIGMLTNVMWDAQLHYRANAFKNMLDWVLQTIEYFSRRSDLQLLIRIHPAEVRGTIPSRQPLVTEIQSAFPTLPPNVFVIPPESHISTYVAISQCNAAIIYGTKTGVELTSMGVPVIVAGEAWLRNKGLTRDASSPEQYFELLDQLPLSDRLSEDVRQRALKYAYHFFFRRMIPVRKMVSAKDWAPYRLRISSLKDLLPGKDPGLDVICDGILQGTDFIYPAEVYGVE